MADDDTDLKEKPRTSLEALVQPSVSSNIPADWEKPGQVKTDPSLLPGMIDPATAKSYGEMMTKGLGDASRAEDANIGRLERRSKLLEDEFAATGVKPGQFPKWDAEAQSKKFTTDPLQAFGSLGSVVGMLASAFTHAPLENGLNASAAAMNAIRAGDQEGYERAHSAWKENIDLAFKRHQLEREHFSDALRLFDTDMKLGEAKARAVATRFGAQQKLWMIENGHLSELFEVQAKEAETFGKLQQSYNNIRERGFNNLVLEKMIKDNEQQYGDDPVKLAGANQHAVQVAHMLKDKNFNNQLLGQWQMEFKQKNQRWPDQNEILAQNTKINESNRAGVGVGMGSPEMRRQVAYEDAEMQRLIENEKLSPTEAALQAHRNWVASEARAKGEGKTGRTSMSGVEAKQVETLKAELMKSKEQGGEGLSETEADAKALQTVERNKAAGRNKIDQALVNELEHYPGMKVEDLGYIQPAAQPRLTGAFDSARNLEAIASFIQQNPKSLGLVADTMKRLNLDAYQGMLSGDKVVADFDHIVDSEVSRKKIDLTQAQSAKVLNKMLTTQAFADAATAGARGGTIFLDRAFKEIYQQASSPGAFFSVLEKRYDEANRVAEKYKMGFDKRDDLNKMPFWTHGPGAYVVGKKEQGKQSKIVRDFEGQKYEFVGTDPTNVEQWKNKDNWMPVGNK